MASDDQISRKRKRIPLDKEESAFPRGGGSILTPLEHKQIQIQASRDVLFENQDNELSEAYNGNRDKINKRPRTNTKSRKNLKDDFSTEVDEKTSRIESLNFKRVVTGSLVLGQVAEINEFEIALSLPNNLTGYVSITSISDRLAERLEIFTDITEEFDNNVTQAQPIILQNLFKIGQYLRAYVVSTIDETSSSTTSKAKKRIELSIRPHDSNRRLDPRNIVVNCTLMASVTSIEDHGVVLDLGLADPSVKGFMSSKKTGFGLNLSDMHEGTTLLCIVTGVSSNGKILKLTTDQDKIGNPKKNHLSVAPSVESFLPGTVVEATISETNSRGLLGKVMGMVDVTADLIHSGVGISGKICTKDKVGSKLMCRVICTFPQADSPKLGVSILSHVLNLTNKLTTKDGEKKELTALLPLSSIVEKIVVNKVVPNIGLFVDVDAEGIPGFVHISRISDKKIEKLSETTGPYKVSSSHRGRLIGFNSMDGLYIISLQDSIIKQPYLRIEDLKVGSTVQGKIEKLIVNSSGTSGLLVNLADGISGLVPQAHMSDVKLIYPEKKFKEGDNVNARILSTNSKKRQVRLTLKKSLVNSKGIQFLTYEDIKPHMQSPGTIVNIIPNGAVIQFYGNVRGFLPVAEMSEAYIQDPSQHFHIGQVVNVHVLDVDPETERMTVSCKDPSSLSSSQQIALQKLENGEIVSAKVLGKSEDEIQVAIEGSELHALLPVGHLTDGSISKNNFALKKIRIGGILQDLVVLEKVEKQRLIILTNKPSLVKDARSNQLVKSFDDVRLNSIVHGFVKNINSSGVFVKFCGNLTALLPKTKLPDSVINLPEFGMKRFQSVEAKVISVDHSQKRFQLSIKDLKNDCNSGLEMRNILNPIDKDISDLNEIVIGKCTKARITSVKDTQINVQLADNVKGRVDISQIFDSWESIKDRKRPLKSFSPKQIIDVRVLGTHDARKHCFLPFTHRNGKMSVFELSAKPSDQIGQPKEALTLDRIELKSTWISFVNNVANDCLWVNLSPNIRGRIAALDVSDDVSVIEDLESNFPVGSALKVHVINVDTANNRLDLSARPKNSDQLSLKNLSKGMIVPGKVVKKDQRHLLVQLGESLFGQVHITDLSDCFSEADLMKYSKNDIIRVCVCSIDAPNKKIRLSTRPSQVLNSSLAVQDPYISSVDQLKVNDVVRGFIKNVTEKGIFVSLSCNITAYARVSDLSDSYLEDWKSNFEIDKLVRGKVISVDQPLNHVQISLKSSIFERDYEPPITFQSLKVGQFITGKVRKVEDFGIFIVIDGSDNISGLCHKSELADKRIHDVKKLYEIGDAVKAVVLKIENEKRRVNFGLKTSYFNDPESDKESDDAEYSSEDSEKKVSSDNEEGGVKISQAENTNSPKTNLSQFDEGGTNFKDLNHLPILDPGGFDWSAKILDQVDIVSDEISESSGAEKKQTKRPKKSKTVIDRTGDLDTNEPRSVDDFERHLLGQSDSSILWIKYMAFLVQSGNLNKAREIAERAIKTINIKEETEKLNVWIALLNLENVYGSDETLEEVFKRACLHNDDQEIHERLVSIFIQSGKHVKADSLFQILTKKFGHSPTVWYNYAHFLYTTILSPDRARALLLRATQSIPTHTHLNLTLKFAALEFNSPSGSPERGRTIIEGVLSTFPKRFDIWNQLLDLEIQQGDPEIIRGVFQRVIKSKFLKPRGAKKWFKKWSDWEEVNGDTKSRERVKAQAEDWVRIAAKQVHEG
ncbi:rRNA biogenesis protein rrp5 [Golovinomyces cichoracearum]|uniref:rRNA biogenesis protein RRP5 n=1 Tax=Golovinomyces cichoracearum TaxID=62708 RepID=A0A420I223_9PEZI|nr:rRNA biogenesis protein rrp5 [Golovinomyces cichoracearum]